MMRSNFLACLNTLAVFVLALVFVSVYILNNRDGDEGLRQLMINEYSEATSVTSGMRSTAIVGIFCSTKDEKARQEIRDTWVSTGDERVCPLPDFLSGTKPECRVAYTFVIGGGDTKKALPDFDKPYLGNPDEARTMLVASPPTDEIDVTYLDIRENMNEGKSFSWLKYAATLNEDIKMTRDHQHIDYVVKMDRDTLLAPSMMLDFMDINLPPAPYNRGIYAGVPSTNPLLHTIYMLGQFYMMSIDVAKHIGITLTAQDRYKLGTGYYWDDSLKLKISLEHEDIVIGVLVSSNPWPIKYLNLLRYRFWRHGMKAEGKLTNYWAHGEFDKPGKVESIVEKYAPRAAALLSPALACGREGKMASKLKKILEKRLNKKA